MVINRLIKKGRVCRLALLGAIFVAVFAHSSQIRAQDIFTAPPISVEARAQSELAAKNIALDRAKALALGKIFDRLTLDTPGFKASDVPAGQIEEMIRDMRIDQERFGGGQYLARVTVRFFPNRVLGFFTRNQIQYSVSVGPNLLVLPLLELGEQQLLWQSGNPWAAVWQALAEQRTPDQEILQESPDSQPSTPQTTTSFPAEFVKTRQVSDGLLGMIVPFSDAPDQAALPVDRVRQSLPPGDPATRDEGRALLTGRYGTDGILIASLKLDRFGVGELAELSLFPDAPAWRNVVIPLRFSSDSGESREAFLARIARETVAALNRIWITRTFVAPDAPLQTVPVRIDLTGGLQEWLEIEGVIKNLPGMKTLEIKSLSVDRAYVLINQQGGEGNLSIALAGAGYQLLLPPADESLESGLENGLEGQAAQGIPTNSTWRLLQKSGS